MFTPVRSACRTSRPLTKKKLCPSRRRLRSQLRRNSPWRLKFTRTRMAHASPRPPSQVLRDRTSAGQLPVTASPLNPDRAAGLFAEARSRAMAYRGRPLHAPLHPAALPAHAGPAMDRRALSAPHPPVTATEMEITPAPRPEQTATAMPRMPPTEPDLLSGRGQRMEAGL